MPRLHSARIVFLPGLCLLAGSLLAAEPDPDLPQPFDLGVAKQMLANPPFTRPLNLSESLTLTGVAYVQGKPVATVKDTSTNKSYVVTTEEPNVLGWRLTEATPATQLRRAEVKLAVGGEIVSIHSREASIAPKAAMNPMPSRIPTKEEFTGHDEKGDYVRGVPYLTDQDRERFRNGISKETREKFLDIVHNHRDMLFKASHEDRAAFVKKAFDAVAGK